jgi:hypothetical protein
MSAERRVVHVEDFCAEWLRTGDVIQVCMWGTAESLSEQALVSTLNEVRASAGESRPTEIRIDIRAIEFLHSGCLKYLVNWITPLQNQAGEIYKISLVWNPSMNWQKRTIYVLCSLAPAVLTAVTVDEPIRPRPLPVKPSPLGAAKAPTP